MLRRKRFNLPEGAVNFNIGTLVGSFEKGAGMLDEVANVQGTKGILLGFDRVWGEDSAVDKVEGACSDS